MKTNSQKAKEANKKDGVSTNDCSSDELKSDDELIDIAITSIGRSFYESSNRRRNQTFFLRTLLVIGSKLCEGYPPPVFIFWQPPKKSSLI